MNGLKTLVFSIIFTIMITASPTAAEPGKYGFYMNFTAIGESFQDFDYNDERVDIIRPADYTAASAGMVRFGYGLGKLRADLEFGVHTLDIENVRRAVGGNGVIDVYTAMINGAMDFNPIGDVTPYLALGIGGALGDGSISYTDGHGDAEKSTAANIKPTGHVGVGGRMALSHAAKLTLGYSFLMAPSNADDQGQLSQTHSLTLGFDYKF